MFEKVSMRHRMLWQLVLEAAVKDYKAEKLPRSYFVSKDFRYVCQLAGVSEVAVLDLL